MADERTPADERRVLARLVRQRIESLARAGVDRIPQPARHEPAQSSADSPAAPDRERPADSPVVPSGAPAGPVAARDDRRAGSQSRPAPSDSTFRLAAGRAAPEHHAPPTASLWSLSAGDKSGQAAPAPMAASLFSSSEFDAPPVPACDRPALLDALGAQVSVCRKCPHLAETRTQTVFGVGSSTARLMFIGEAPGADEDRQGEPFVGRAGQLLTDMITKGMGLTRDQVYIANILKCRPPENRTPTPEECDNCIGYLEEQIAIIRPEYICLLGRVALQGLLRTSISMGKARGRWHRYRGIPTIVTYHPAYLLRKPECKRETWEDLQELMKAMGLSAQGRKGRPGERPGG